MHAHQGRNLKEKGSRARNLALAVIAPSKVVSKYGAGVC
jgi:hypothetical protein